MRVENNFAQTLISAFIPPNPRYAAPSIETQASCKKICAQHRDAAGMMPHRMPSTKGVGRTPRSRKAKQPRQQKQLS